MVNGVWGNGRPPALGAGPRRFDSYHSDSVASVADTRKGCLDRVTTPAKVGTLAIARATGVGGDTSAFQADEAGSTPA